MQIRITYIGTLDGVAGMWCGFCPEEAVITEERQVLFPADGYMLKRIATEEVMSSVWLKDGDTQANYEEVEDQDPTDETAMLHLTRGDVFRGLYQAKGITRAQVRALIEAMPEETQAEVDLKELASIDFDEALYFYRGNKLIDNLGEQLGITSDQMTRFFVTNDYHVLVTVVE